MIYCVLFEEDPAHADMRLKHMPAHLAFLKQHHGKLVDAAGPLREAESGWPAGGLRIVQAEGAQAVRDLVEADPYWPTGLRKTVRIYEWEQVSSRP